VYRWLAGENAVTGHIRDLGEAATDLAQFVLALQKIDISGASRPGTTGRGGPLATRDADTRSAIASLDGLVDTDAVSAAWDDALGQEPWGKPPVWMHGDLAPGNLLVTDGRLSAVIDFGALNIGDPAVDLIVAWNLLPADARAVFRDALGVDDATWARGRGWALSIALIALPYYLRTNPVIVANSRHVIDEVLADRGGTWLNP
jgi:aminoglycoside phosphotransferase (APT) family kinase protein